MRQLAAQEPELNRRAAAEIGVKQVCCTLPELALPRPLVWASGPDNGQLMLMLHGLPECWVSYAKLIPGYVAKGFRVVVPDMRGYDLSDEPPKLEDVSVVELVEDVEEMIDKFNKCLDF
eukprot:EC788011.1.p2 GENE.EC788011.1~~EC788011.1.p2  ORF type:complete len:119 (+),score=37.29 EC788011.1:77-433(+)